MTETVPAPTPITPPAPAPAASPNVGAYLLSGLRMAVGIAAGPGGIGLLMSMIGTNDPLVTAITQFGVRALAGILPQLTAETITDDEIAMHLKVNGSKVEPYDPMAAYQKALAEAGG